MKNLFVLTIAAFLALPAWAQTNPIEIEETSSEVPMPHCIVTS